MKKVLVFFAIFFLVAARLAAEDVVNDKQRIVNFQLSAGTGIGASALSFVVDTDLYFRLKRFERGDNIYLGLDAAFRYTPFLTMLLSFLRSLLWLSISKCAAAASNMSGSGSLAE